MIVLQTFFWIALGAVGIQASPDIYAYVKGNAKPARAAVRRQAWADWDAARNLRPCIGQRDPACKYPTPEEVRERAKAIDTD